jgi:hypothetical protein
MTLTVLMQTQHKRKENVSCIEIVLEKSCSETIIVAERIPMKSKTLKHVT